MLWLQNDCNLVTKCLGYEIDVTKCLITKNLKLQKFQQTLFSENLPCFNNQL